AQGACSRDAAGAVQPIRQPRGCADGCPRNGYGRNNAPGPSVLCRALSTCAAGASTDALRVRDGGRVPRYIGARRLLFLRPVRRQRGGGRYVFWLAPGFRLRGRKRRARGSPTVSDLLVPAG